MASARLGAVWPPAMRLWQSARVFKSFCQAAVCCPSVKACSPEERSSLLTRQKSSPSTIFNSAGVATVGARKERSVAALFRARCKTSNLRYFEAVVSSAHTAFSLTTSSTCVRPLKRE